MGRPVVLGSRNDLKARPAPCPTTHRGLRVNPRKMGHDIIIIGSGLAGLQAALVAISNGGLKPLILEARERVGGRAYTDPTALVDMGCAQM